MTHYDEISLTPQKPTDPTQAELDIHGKALSQKEQSEVMKELIEMVQNTQEELYFSQRRLQWAKATIHAIGEQ